MVPASQLINQETSPATAICKLQTVTDDMDIVINQTNGPIISLEAW